MEQKLLASDVQALPHEIPIFPLTGALLLPGGVLPLNIFEPRYVQMVDHALSGARMIGMVQSLAGVLCQVGCAGRITEFSETSEGGYLIKLSGICRFKIQEEPESNKAFRIVKPDWAPYSHDLGSSTCLDIDRTKLKSMLRDYFDRKEMSCDWQKVETATDNRLITCLSMICPFSPQEKQALLESPTGKDRAQLFMKLLEMALFEHTDCGRCH